MKPTSLLAARSRQTFSSDWIICVILAVGIMLRILLGLYNNAANDNHIEVADRIVSALFTNRISPPYDVCWECYHPRLFHFFITFPCILGKTCTHEAMRLFAQVLNTTLSCGLLLIVAHWVQLFVGNRSVRRYTFALVALNPRLLYIGSQSSNDMFAIFFGVAASYYLHLFLVQRDWKSIVLSAGTFLMAFYTKGSAYALFAGVGIALLMTAWLLRGESRRFLWKPLVCFGIAFGALFVTPDDFAPYKRYLQQSFSSGSAGAVNFSERPPVPFWEKEYVARPGIISIVHSYFTFRLIGMLEVPWVTQDTPPVPYHRTSFWSQLYGRYHFIFFDQWPFQRTDGWALWIGRFSIFFGLLPTLCFCLGGVSFVRSAVRSRQDSKLITWLKEGACLVPISLSYIALVIAFAYSHRGFESIKTIYLLPGLIGFIAMYVRGYRVLTNSFGRYVILGKCLVINTWILIVVYFANALLMFDFLARRHIP